MAVMRGFADDAVEFLHLRRTADNAAETQFGFDLLAQRAVFGFQFQVARHAFQQQLKLFHAEGLGDVVVSSVLHGLDGRLDGAVSGDHHDDRVGSAFADLVQRLQTPRSRQLQIEQDDIDILGVEQTIGMLADQQHELSQVDDIEMWNSIPAVLG